MALKSFYETGYGLKGNPFPGGATYAEDTHIVYVPEMFGEQRQEFLRKFILAPLEDGQPVLGAVWSVVPGDPEARGFGKSTLMGEEAKLINQDFGRATLMSLGVDEEDAKAHPTLAGYVAFDTRAQGGIGNIDSAAFHLVRFMLRGTHAGSTVHQRLREAAAAMLVADGRAKLGAETDGIVAAVRDRFRELAVSIDIRNLLEIYLLRLASAGTDELNKFLSDKVGTWHHDRNGLKYLQIFTVFAELAGVEHFTFFLDQVEDFTSNSIASKIAKNVKIIRDALLESEPFSSRASFVFQLHPQAYVYLRDAWEHEDLRSLDYEDPMNESVVVVLKGLEAFPDARLAAKRFLNHPNYALPTRAGDIEPFNDEALRQIWEASKGRPRVYLKYLHTFLKIGKDAKAKIIDSGFVSGRLQAIGNSAEAASGQDEDERLA
jgi:hypothetical protein